MTNPPVASQQRIVRQLHHDPHDRPFIVIWEVTRACQLVCKHCRADAQHHANPHQLSTEQGKALLSDIAGFEHPRPIVVLTGGDPFERADLEELVAYGTSLGLSMALSPSVTPKFTHERLGALREAGGKAVSLSLDGARPETHDSFRGFSGTFDATMQAATIVKDHGFRLQVNSTVTSRTVAELPDLLARVMSMGAALWSVFFLVPTGRGQALEALTAEEIEDVLHWLHEMSDVIAIKTTEAPHYRRVAIQRAAARQAGRELPQRGPLFHSLMARTAEVIDLDGVAHRRPRPPIDVNSGRGFAFIDHVGDVYPSGFLPYRCGSVKTESFRDIYRHTPILRALRTPEDFHGKCGVCEFREVCGGSRSHTFAVTGDPLGSDPTCTYIPAGCVSQQGAAAPAAEPLATA